MTQLERFLTPGPTLAEISSSFLRIKTAAKKVAPPDESGALEGQFSVPVEKALVIMGELVKNEFETLYAYHVYANSLRDLSHDSIAEHFEAHAEEELEHADFLLRRMSVLGGPIHVPDLQSPSASSNPVEIIKTMVRMEQEAVAGWKKLLAVVGDNPMKVTIEDYAAKEQEHLDDLWQLLPHEENRPVLQQKMAGFSLPKVQAAIAGAHPLAASRFGSRMGLMAQTAKNPAVARAAEEASTAAKQKAVGVLPAINPMRKAASAISAMRKMAFDGDVNEWMAREQLLNQAQGSAEAYYFKNQAQQSQAVTQQKDQELQAVQQQMQALQQQQMQMQQELDQSGQTQRQILEQARQVETSATQAAASAHQTATASMLQAMQSQQEVLRHKGMTANMQQNVQTWKDQLMQIAQTDPTQGAGAQVGMPGSGPIQPAVQLDPMMGQPMQQGMNAMPEGAGETPTAGGEANNGPAAEAPGAEGNPSAPTPTGAGAQSPAKTEQQTPEQTLSPAATSKQGSVNWKVLGAMAGFPTGAALAYGMSKQVPDEKLMAHIKEREDEEARGEGSFSKSMDLAKSKMRLSIQEAAQKHPHGAVMSGGLTGASLGAGLGFAASKVPGHIKNIVQNWPRS